MIRLSLLILTFVSVQELFGAEKTKHFYINEGQWLTVDSNRLPYTTFNSSVVFDSQNERLNLIVGDSLFWTISNNTADTHGIIVKDFGIDSIIMPGDSILLTIHFVQPGIFVFSDIQNDQRFHQRGAAGMILVRSDSDFQKSTFYWNIKDLQSDKLLSLDSGKTITWDDYYPDYFTVNGKGKPELIGDAEAAITGTVGETIFIAISNTGNCTHSIHFHGYHCTAYLSNSSRIQQGSIKDTFPFEKGSSALLKLVPDKTGQYPVHDHNLIAVSGGGKYPNGIFIMMDIK